MQVALSVGVQRMISADTGAAGVMFSIDTETGFRDAFIIINNNIRVHRMALLQPDRVKGKEARNQIKALTAPWEDRTWYFVDQLTHGIARIAASQYP